MSGLRRKLQPSDEAGLARYKVREALPFSGYLYVQAPHEKPPAWLQFVQSGVENRIEGLVNASTAAVLFIKAGGRRFAITFGYGRNLLKQESLERDFGLKVALNTVNPDNLRLEHFLSRGSGLHEFAYNPRKSGADPWQH